METKSSNKKLRNALTITLFTFSALISFALLIISVWGDVEASMFDPSLKGEERLTSLACPVLITPQDDGEFTAEFSNPLSKDIEPSLQVHISSGHITLMEEERIKVDLAPNETKKLAWSVNPENAAYDKMVLVNVYKFPFLSLPSQKASCGIFVMDIPVFTGKQVLFSGLGFGFLGMVLSIGLWQFNNRVMTKNQRELFRAMSILTGAIIIGIVFSLMGWWLIGSLGVVVAVLMGVITVTHQF